MSSAISTTTDLAAARDCFEAALPGIDPVLGGAFRRLPRDLRLEAIAEARAAAWAAWCGLLRRGKDPLAVGAAGIAFNATRSVKNGRRVGSPRAAGRGRMDVHNRKAQRKHGFAVVSLEAPERSGHGGQDGAWEDYLAGGKNRLTPAEEAAFRIDFAAWLNGLPVVARQAAELLAAGSGTGETAQACGVSAGRISQLRSELRASWSAFQGEAGR